MQTIVYRRGGYIGSELLASLINDTALVKSNIVHGTKAYRIIRELEKSMIELFLVNYEGVAFGKGWVKVIMDEISRKMEG